MSVGAVDFGRRQCLHPERAVDGGLVFTPVLIARTLSAMGGPIGRVTEAAGEQDGPEMDDDGEEAEWRKVHELGREGTRVYAMYAVLILSRDGQGDRVDRAVGSTR